MSFSQFRITVFPQSRIDLLKHKKTIGPYGRQFDRSITYLVSIKTSANASLSSLPYPTRRTHPTPTHQYKPYSILLYSTILNLFIVYQYYIMYPTPPTQSHPSQPHHQYYVIYKKKKKIPKANVFYPPNPTS